MAGNRLPHILLPDLPENNAFTSTQSGRDKGRIPERERQTHSAFVKQQLEAAWSMAEHEQAVCHVDRRGVYIEFKGEEGFDLVTKSLESRTARDQNSWIKLLNVRKEMTRAGAIETDGTAEAITYATVFIPHDKKNFFFDRIEKYANENDQRSGKPKNYKLIDSISDLRKALDIDSFWQDDRALIPDETPDWCEVWLSSDTHEVIVTDRLNGATS